jgi:hypothetical protein
MAGYCCTDRSGTARRRFTEEQLAASSRRRLETSDAQPLSASARTVAYRPEASYDVPADHLVRNALRDAVRLAVRSTPRIDT